MTANGNNGRNQTVTGALTSVSERLIRVLPPAFLLLIIMNLVFLGIVGWLFQHNADMRNALLNKIVEQCLLKERS